MASDRSLVVVVTANLDKMRSELAKGEAVIATTATAMKRMGESYSGATTIAQANAAMLAVQSLGGTTKLTEAEQRKLNSTLTEAVAKYQALGQQAPPDMLKLRDATRQVEAPTSSLTDKMRGLAGAMGIAFGSAAVIAGIKSLISNTFEYAETIKDTSAKMGVSMEATQRWKFAAEQTGASLENVSKSVLKLSQGIAGDDKALKEALQSAGVQFESLKGMKPEEAFNAVAGAIAKIPDPMDQADVALAAFGKSGAELLPALREGFVKIGDGATVMSDKTINALDKAKDKWGEFSNKVTVATGGIIAKVLGMVEKIAPAMQLLFAVTGQRDAAEMWSVFAKSADTATVSTGTLAETIETLPPPIRRTSTGASDLAAKLKILNAEHGRLNPLILATEGRYQNLAAIFRGMPTLSLGALPPPLSIPVSVGPIDFSKLGKQIELGVPPIFVTLGDKIKASLAKSLEGLGSVIIGAIQGGGNVGRAAFASIGASLGNDLGAAIATGIGGSLGKALGSFAGPLGALLGSAVGGLVDKIFGKNQGREDAKSFAAMFGGFDALRQKMLVLGDEGERLWIALTQNTKGPAQVAAAIQAIEDAFARQSESSKKAADDIDDATRREVEAIDKVRQAYDEKISAIQSKMDSLSQSIAQEAPEEIMGVIEAQERAALAQLAIQKKAMEDERDNAIQIAEDSLEQSKKKILGVAETVRDGIQDLFKDPIRLTFDWSGAPGGGGSGGAGGYTPSSRGGSRPGFSRVSTVGASGPTVITVISQLDGREVARNQMRYLPGQLVLAGR